jgi:hypothetical protein
MSNVIPVVGQQYRVSPVSNPYFGIGTVTSVSEKDRTGTIVSEEAGLLYFNDFNLIALSTDDADVANDSVEAILAEIAQLEINKVLPEGGVKTFADLHDYIDANVLVIKHVPRDANWIDAEDDVREAQAELDNLIMDAVDAELRA